jgi:hypothetical protein
MFHRKLELFGYEIGQYLDKLDFNKEINQNRIDSIFYEGSIQLRLIIDKNEQNMHEILIYTDYNSYIGSIIVECYYMIQGDDKRYTDSRLSTETKHIRVMRKYQNNLFPLVEKIQIAIEEYVKEREQESKNDL